MLFICSLKYKIIWYVTARRADKATNKQVEK